MLSIAPEMCNIYLEAAIVPCLLAHHALGLGTQTERYRQIYWGRWKKKNPFSAVNFPAGIPLLMESCSMASPHNM